MKNRLWLISTLVSLILLANIYAARTAKNDVQNDRFPTVMRRIGHQLLLSTGDSLSRVLPVQEPSASTYRIEFEKQISIEPDSLFRIVSRNTESYALPENYTVNVLNCVEQEMVYSFVMADNDSAVIVSCFGRTLPKDCYYIDLDFSSSTNSSSKIPYLVFGALLVSLLLSAPVLVNRWKMRRTAESGENETIIGKAEKQIQIGAYEFDAEKRALYFSGEMIQLTDKEASLLAILSAQPNEVVDRSYLQKEVWEKKGVIVTRSLDVFMSRLRKKLERDSNIKINNVHGKGYKLEMQVN